MSNRQWLSHGGVTSVPVTYEKSSVPHGWMGSIEQEHREKNLKRYSAMQNSEKHKHPEELYTNIAEPDPDYQNDDDTADLPPPPSPLAEDGILQTSNGNTSTNAATSSGPTIIRVKNGSVSSVEDEGEMIHPRKLSNPCVESRERQALHKELLLNYRLGKDVLKKPELEKMMQKRKDAQKRKEWEEVKAGKRTSFELKLEERANRLKADEEKMKPIKEKEDDAPELLRMHRKITSKPPSSPS